MAKDVPEHLDILGQPLAEGNYVAVSHHNMLQICEIKKLNPKMMRVVPIEKSAYRRGAGHLVYSNQSILLSGPDAVAYILKYAGS
jgi:hypothetical protein